MSDSFKHAKKAGNLSPTCLLPCSRRVSAAALPQPGLTADRPFQFKVQFLGSSNNTTLAVKDVLHDGGAGTGKAFASPDHGLRAGERVGTVFPPAPCCERLSEQTITWPHNYTYPQNRAPSLV